jgi:hypothetical protein
MGIRKPDTVGTVLANAAVFGGIGAVLGLGASLLPFIGPAAAVIGGGIGATIGVVKGLVDASDDSDRYNAARAWVQYTYGGNRYSQPMQQQPGNTVHLPQGWTFADLDRLDELFPDDTPRPVAPQPAPATPAPASSSTSTTTTTGTSLAPPPLTGVVTPGAPPALTGL